MKKLTYIFFFMFFFNVSVFADENTRKNTDNFIKDRISKMTVTDVINEKATLEEITSNEDGVQYHFFIRYNNVDGVVPVVCFVSSKSTTCRVP